MELECAACGRPRARVPCRGGCNALAYCSSSHEVLSWPDHASSCARFAAQVGRGQLLRDNLPFPWTSDATERVERGEADACTFLAARGLHKSSALWLRECRCGAAGPFSVPPAPLRRDGSGAGLSNGWGLPPEHAPREVYAGLPRPLPTSWRDYYALASIPLSSPVAVCLDAVLTMVHCLSLTNALPGLDARSAPISPTIEAASARPLVVHLVGARKELDAAVCFAHAYTLLVQPLLRARPFHLLMLGPDVPRILHGTQRVLAPATPTSGGMVLRFATCESYAQLLPPPGAHFYPEGLPWPPHLPHLVFAPNAGVGAYPTEWRNTMGALFASCPAPSACPPVAITDCTEEACRHGAELLAGCAPESGVGRRLCVEGWEEEGGAAQGGGESGAGAARVNPFRRPLSGADASSRLPVYSNGWVCVLRMENANSRV